jgi:hypothetical protein
MNKIDVHPVHHLASSFLTLLSALCSVTPKRSPRFSSVEKQKSLDPKAHDTTLESVCALINHFDYSSGSWA